ncbi:hypothetical protein [Spirillospora sp. NPDC029432]|uniref:RipA family octameric membrane protein n=1 Tax=Spirillospora sp. NPDC029432 TaxID=3154599 RepID=UPI00345127E1
MPCDRDTVLEIYKIAVETTDRASARRGTANAFFLALQTALMGLATTLPPANAFATTAAYLAALTLCGSWWVQLRTYRDLNRAKYETITAIEATLPTALFTEEWANRRRGHVSLGQVERTIPCLFAAIHTMVYISAIAT